MFSFSKLVILICLTVAIAECQKIIHANNGSNRGSWGSEDLCPIETYASYIQVKYQPRGHFDDSYINAIKLYCQTVNGTLVQDIVSKQGTQGQWQGIKGCPNEGRIKGYSMKAQQPAGHYHDDFGVMAAIFICEDDSLIFSESPGIQSSGYKKTESASDLLQHIEELDSANEGGMVVPRYKPVEIWSPQVTCEEGSYVCGIMSRVERLSIFTDDAGLTDFKLYCCF